MFIQLKNSLWKEIFSTIINNKMRGERLEILLFLYVEDFLEALSQEELKEYFNEFSKEEIAKVLMDFYQDDDWGWGIVRLISTKDLLNISDRGIEIALYLTENIQHWAKWGEMRDCVSILKELQEIYPKKKLSHFF